MAVWPLLIPLKELLILPVDFAARNAWDSFAYLSLEFLTLAWINQDAAPLRLIPNCIEMRSRCARRRKANDGIARRITMSRFTRENQIGEPHSAACLYLEDLVLAGTNSLIAEKLLASIQKIDARAKSR